jgi:hypothetical protein
VFLVFVTTYGTLINQRRLLLGLAINALVISTQGAAPAPARTPLASSQRAPQA